MGPRRKSQKLVPRGLDGLLLVPIMVAAAGSDDDRLRSNSTCETEANDTSEHLRPKARAVPAPEGCTTLAGHALLAQRRTRRHRDPGMITPCRVFPARSPSRMPLSSA